MSDLYDWEWNIQDLRKEMELYSLSTAVAWAFKYSIPVDWPWQQWGLCGTAYAANHETGVFIEVHGSHEEILREMKRRNEEYWRAK